MALNTTHHNLCNYENPLDENYLRVRNVLSKIVGGVPMPKSQIDDKIVDIDPDISDIEPVLDSVFSDQKSLPEIQAKAILALLTKDY